MGLIASNGLIPLFSFSPSSFSHSPPASSLFFLYFRVALLSANSLGKWTGEKGELCECGLFSLCASKEINSPQPCPGAGEADPGGSFAQAPLLSGFLGLAAGRCQREVRGQHERHLLPGPAPSQAAVCQRTCPLRKPHKACWPTLLPWR